MYNIYNKLVMNITPGFNHGLIIDSLITFIWLPSYDRVELYMITIYIAIITSGWMKNRMHM